MAIRVIIYFVSLAALIVIVYKANINYSYQDLKDYLSVLQTASSMVFTIMGIWIAFLYPNALQRLVNPEKIQNTDFSQTLSETKRLEGLVGSVLRSAFVVTMIMVIYLSKTVISAFPFQAEHVLYLKSFTLSFAFLLGVLQVESIFYVIYSNVMFINELHSKREDREADADI